MATGTRIALLNGCSDAHCLRMSADLCAQLDPAYSRGAAVMDMRGSFALDYVSQHRTARKRSYRAKRAGFTFRTIDRTEWIDDIYEINISKAQRQGRPMSAGYLEPPVFSEIPMLCDQHHVYTYGVERDETLVAYLWLYRSGQMAMVSSILGHADYLEDGIMYLLYQGTLEEQWQLGGTVFYNLWNSGQEGLRFFKQRVGLHEGTVEWAL